MTGNSNRPTAALSATALAEAAGLRQQLGIGVLGYGSVARRWQVPSYAQAGLNVVAICDTNPEALKQARQAWPSVQSYTSAEEMLADPSVAVVDIATRPPGRLDLIRQSVTAGRHILAQKPLAADPHSVAELVDLARQAGVTIAVNQNGRFAPAWRATTDLIRNGRIGTIRAVTHVYDTNLRWTPNPALHGTDQFLLFDYSNHWIDISGLWLHPDPIAAVQAREYTLPRDADGCVQQTMWISLEAASGASVLIRGAAAGTSHSGHRFLVQGDQGTIRGDVDSADREYVEAEIDGQRVRQDTDGSWFPDGFLGSMVELLRSIASGTEPPHSLADNQRTVTLVAAVCRSARNNGSRVEIPWAAEPGPVVDVEAACPQH